MTRPIQTTTACLACFILSLSITAFTGAAHADHHAAGETKPEAAAPKADKSALLDPASEACTQKAPDHFQARFETTSGPFVIEIHREWAPKGADRFYNLVLNGFFDNTTFFRVVPNFVVQFGLNGDPKINAAWKNANIRDDKVLQTNKRGRITFATSGPNSRTTQLFINLNDNAFLDSMDFAPFGEIVNGMQNVDRIFAGYGEKPRQDLIQSQGDAYLEKSFPNITRITQATILAPAEKEAEEAAE